MLTGLLAVGLCSAQVLVSSPVADLRAKPQDAVSPLKYWTDPDELTQTLYGEYLFLKQVKGEWTEVEAPEQPNRVNDTWRGYMGWIRSSHLLTAEPHQSSMAVIQQWAPLFRRSCSLQGCVNDDVLLSLSFGTWLEPVGGCELGWQQVKTVSTNNATGWVQCSSVASFVSSLKDVRLAVPTRIGVLLGFPYHWGGRSALSLPMLEQGTQLTGVDCSGLVSLFYRSFGWILPRDASKQAIIAKNVSLPELQVGDLFFYGIPNSTVSPVTHVMMLYSLSPEPCIVESASNSTRILSVAAKYGVPFDGLRWGQPLKGGMNPGAILSWGAITGEWPRFAK